MLVPVLLLFCTTLVFLIGLLFFILYITLYRAPSTTSKASLGRSAAVVVLGDIGRSPRMCYHVESLANEGWKVAVVGYRGTAPPPALRRASIKHHHLRTPPAFIARLPRAAFALVAPFKVALQSISLFWQLAAAVQPPPELVLVQTPPALPTLFVVRLVCALLGSKLIIDWHNLGYTILALRMGHNSFLVRLAEKLERITGRRAFAHLFVTRAMMNHLDRKWNLSGIKSVLYDRPPAHFHRASTLETHQLMCRLAPTLSPPLGDFFPTYAIPGSTPFTRLAKHPSSPDRRDSSDSSDAGYAQPRDDRPALVLSSTSWTADEDFGLLLHAARLYERRARQLAADAKSESESGSNTQTQTQMQMPAEAHEHHPGWTHKRAPNGDSIESISSPTCTASSSNRLGYDAEGTRTSKERRRPSLGALRSATLPNEPVMRLPKMLIVVTGKGELKASYEREIARLEKEEKWEWVRIRTAWLETEDYPVLLGSADVGVSLHTSSSGLDLPMKVVDMLGCGLPVCALDFACLSELVQDGRNGVIFRDAEGLERQLESLLALHPSPNWLVHGAGMVNPFETASTLPMANTPPLSPNPALSLLPSPLLAPQAERSRTATWAGNWKTVVRPILLEERRLSFSDSTLTMPLLHQVDSSCVSSPRSSLDLSASASASASAAAGEEDQAPVADQGFAQDKDVTRGVRLRHRKSVRQTPTLGQLVPTGEGQDIPHIQVSHAGA